MYSSSELARGSFGQEVWIEKEGVGFRDNTCKL